MATDDNGRFAGKVAFVTGAGSGIGRVTAPAFAREGANAGGTSEGRQLMVAGEPVGRLGERTRSPRRVLWLCSDAASFVVGHAMVVDGGQTT